MYIPYGPIFSFVPPPKCPILLSSSLTVVQWCKKRYWQILSFPNMSTVLMVEPRVVPKKPNSGNNTPYMLPFPKVRLSDSILSPHRSTFNAQQRPPFPPQNFMILSNFIRIDMTQIPPRPHGPLEPQPALAQSSAFADPLSNTRRDQFLFHFRPSLLIPPSCRVSSRLSSRRDISSTVVEENRSQLWREGGHVSWLEKGRGGEGGGEKTRG